jgi:hypothetical protein
LRIERGPKPQKLISPDSKPAIQKRPRKLGRDGQKPGAGLFKNFAQLGLIKEMIDQDKIISKALELRKSNGCAHAHRSSIYHQ